MSGDKNCDLQASRSNECQDNTEYYGAKLYMWYCGNDRRMYGGRLGAWLLYLSWLGIATPRSQQCNQNYPS